MVSEAIYLFPNDDQFSPLCIGLCLGCASFSLPPLLCLLNIFSHRELAAHIVYFLAALYSQMLKLKISPSRRQAPKGRVLKRSLFKNK